jgi:hypothetical protein
MSGTLACPPRHDRPRVELFQFVQIRIPHRNLRCGEGYLKVESAMLPAFTGLQAPLSSSEIDVDA